MTTVRRHITMPLEMDEFIKENCLSYSRIFQKAIRELMEKEKEKQEGNN